MSNYTFFTSNNNKIIFNDTYNDEIDKRRVELDKRLNILYKNRDVIKNTQQKEIDANVYANIMLTVLGTCLLYFSFFKVIQD
uniref:Uncharacterized protein n=1 Tax=viral metagenome TaxID=1070528 RepID=A0A6C0ERG0_9ZZZZ